MTTNRATFFGIHKGQPAKATFQSAIGRIWKVTLEVAGKKISLQCSSRNVKPCMTHATYLLNKHFPGRFEKAPGRKQRKVNAHEATVVESSFVEHKTGSLLRIVK
ncbi:MAG TPA: hypothetical protein VL175_07340 [Pirellulales bacterium]|jgi:hypothetical protein|nr:hypothetical protein [Pirellulales bacterium]